MRKKLPIRLILVPAVLGLLGWWLWPVAQQSDLFQKNKSSLGGRGLVSAIQPVDGVSANSSLSGSGDYSSVPIAVLDDASKKELSSKFQRAQQAFEQGNSPRAIEILSELTIDYPHIIEPYVNLSAAFAADGQLEQARQTLIRAVDVNKTYARIFENLQKVHGALAANAYRSALEQEKQLISSIELPLLDEVSLAPSGEQMLALMQQKEADYRGQLETMSAQLTKTNKNLETANALLTDSTDSQSVIAGLQSQLTDAEQQISSLQNQASLVVVAKPDGLNSSIENQNLIASNDRKDAQAADGRIAAANLKRQQAEQRILDDQQAKERELAAIKLAELEKAKLAELALLSEQEQKDKEIAAIQNKEQEARDQQNRDGQQEKAIGLVKSWAKAWSDQNVDGYVAHYRDGYTPPGSDITHTTWLQQRQARLTNKKFIQVDVTNFAVQNSGNKFFVTFTQRYKSNTMDDTIRKQLQFAKNGSDWDQAKIIGERVVR